MATSFISHALILNNLFHDRFQYTIPLYQRPYSWSIKESSRLLDDLISAMGDAESGFNFETYFLGAMILTGSKNQIARQSYSGQLIEAFKTIVSGETNLPPAMGGDFAVVDGKQRLITLKILLCLLRDLSPDSGGEAFAKLLGNGDKTNAYRLNMDGGESDFFTRHVLTPGSTLLEINPENLPESQKNIMLARDSLRETLNDLDASEREKLFDYIVNHCEIVVILTEEFANAYQIFVSINDTGSPLSPGDVLKAELMSKINPRLVKQYKSIWAQWNDSLGEPETNRRGRKTFFSHFWYALTSNPTNMLKDIRKVVDETGGAIPFIDNTLIPHATAYQIIKNRDWPHPTNKTEMDHLLGILDWLPQDEWMSSAMLAITRIGNEPDKILDFFKQLERLAYGQLILPIGARGRRKRYNPVRRGLRDPNSGKDPFKEVLLSPLEQKSILSVISQGLHRSHSPAAKLILMRLDQKASGRPLSYYQQIEQKEPLSVEHLLPRNPSAKGGWVEDFPVEKERDYYTELLGNLFLVLETDNAAMKNYDYPIKNEILFDKRPVYPAALTNNLQSVPDWTQERIETRQAHLLSIVTGLWALNGNSET